jgi:hypothetical protein
MADERIPVTFQMNADDLQFLIWAMRFCQGGPHDQEKQLERWEAVFTQSLGKHFDDELPAHVMDDDE